jgi:1,4-dihydroxy-2-naphthoate octaprenyltransferase
MTMAARNISAPGHYLAPLPFLLAGFLPFWAGTLLAMVSGYPLRPWVLLAGAVAVAALVLAACSAREIFAPGAGRYPAWRLASFPGSRVSRTGEADRPAYLVAYALLGLAAFLGLVLQFLGQTGNLTIPLGALGVLGGYFSFAPPLAWRRRGLGEVAGGLCFGLLPMLTGFYLQSGYWVAEELFYGLPLTLTGFNLFLIHGFPDHQEEAPARHTLAARWGPVTGALIYTVLNVLVILLIVVLLFFPASPLPFRAAIWPVLVLAVFNQELLKRRAYRDETRLRLLCRLSLALHLGMGAVFCLMLWQRL